MINISIPKDSITITTAEGKSISEALKENNVFLLAPCGGYHRCGKCRIRVLKGSLKISDADRNFLSEAEMEAGVRLACSAYPDSDIEIELPDDAANEMAVIGYAEGNSNTCAEQIGSAAGSPCHFGIAIDIGTTTLAAALVNITQKCVIDTTGGLNSQVSFGSDVLTRISACNEGKSEQLTHLICTDLSELIKELLIRNRLPAERIEKMAVAANTTMVHILMGFTVKNLGVYPFTPVSVEAIHVNSKELFDVKRLDADVYVFPGVSAFIGGDIVSGLHSLKISNEKNPSLCAHDEPFVYLDFGTNAEMIVGNENHMLAASAAAGPCFEGGSLSCGMGATKGAISHCNIDGGNVQLEIIEDAMPRGLCGSGAIEVVSELLDEGILDRMGIFSKEYEAGFDLGMGEDGSKIILLQEDVSKLQLAKAAIRAGIEILLEKYGVGKEKIKRVYIAGGFGFYLDADKAANIGLIPSEWAGKIVSAGNASLKGAIEYLAESKCDDGLRNVTDTIETVNLNLEADFDKRFIDYMPF